MGPVVLGPRRRIGQEVKSPLDVLEALSGAGLVVDVRVVLEDELAPRLGDLRIAGVAGYAKYRVRIGAQRRPHFKFWR